MRIILFGYGEMGCTGLEYLLEQKEKIVGVVTHRDDPHENRWFRSLAERAAKAKLEIFYSDDFDKAGLEGLVKRLQPDVILSFYYRDMIPVDVLKLAPKGAMNLHGSYLPRLRGRAPLNWALVECEEQTGVTLHHMVKEPDAGDIVAQRAFPIGPKDTARTLFDKAVAETKSLLKVIWPKIKAETAPRIPQDDSKATYRGRRRPEDGLIDWTQPTKRIDGLVRAVTDPYPGAFTTIQGKKLMVWAGSPARGSGKPGSLIGDAVVATGDGAYRIDKCEFSDDKKSRPVLKTGTQLGG